MFVSQEGKSLKWYFTKDNPHDLPQLERKTVNGQQVWDATGQQEFFIDMITKSNQMLFGKLGGVANQNIERIVNPEIDADSLTAPVDDLPF